jgi:uncharacterized OsmC-like protein
MSTLRDYLQQKRAAIEARRTHALTEPQQPHLLKASVSAEGRSGIRRIRIRDFQVISDSGPDFAGYDLGPSSPELHLGVLGSCLTHVFLIQAADLGIPLDSLSVEVTGQIDPRAGKPGFESVPVYPHNIAYDVRLESPASSADIAALHDAVERACPILNLLLNPQEIRGSINHVQAAEPALAGRAG